MTVNELITLAKRAAEDQSVSIDLPLDNDTLYDLQDYLSEGPMLRSAVMEVVLTWGLTSAEQSDDGGLEVYFRTRYADYIGRRKNDMETALQEVRRARKLAEEIEDTEGYLYTVREEGDLRVQYHQFDDAIRIYAKGYRLAYRTGTEDTYAKFIRNIGRMYGLSGKSQKAIRWLKKGLAFSKKNHLYYIYLDHIQELGNLYARNGERDLAIETFQNGLDYISQIPPEKAGHRAGERMVSMCYGLSGAQRAQENYHDALASLKRAQQVLAMQPNEYYEMLISHLLALIYWTLKQYDKSILYHQKASELACLQGNRDFEVVSQIYIGGVLFDQKQWEAAQEIYEKWLPELEKVHQPHILVNSWFRLGDIYYELNADAQAKTCFEKGIQLASGQIPDESGYEGLGKIYQRQGKIDQALSSFERALSGYRKNDEMLSTIQMLHKIGGILAQSENESQYEKAVSYFEEAAELLQKLWEKYTDQYEAMERDNLDQEQRGEYYQLFVHRYRELVEENFSHVRGIIESLSSSQQKLSDVQKSLHEQQHIVSKLSTPVIQLWDGILCMPLVGDIDDQRANQVMEALLTDIVKKKAEIILLDITGVPMVDTNVANYLIQTVRASQLLGAEAVLVGIRPPIAQTLIHLGLDLTGIVTLSNLQQGLQYALKRLNWTIQLM
ncbi:MAG: STAS domain-containing protein [Gemmatimonadetes bacterium]|nr:MAG: STAS domain-containing protein [Gemmatimonadota bacterium]